MSIWSYVRGLGLLLLFSLFVFLNLLLVNAFSFYLEFIFVWLESYGIVDSWTMSDAGPWFFVRGWAWFSDVVFLFSVRLGINLSFIFIMPSYRRLLVIMRISIYLKNFFSDGGVRCSHFPPQFLTRLIRLNILEHLRYLTSIITIRTLSLRYTRRCPAEETARYRRFLRTSTITFQIHIYVSIALRCWCH